MRFIFLHLIHFNHFLKSKHYKRTAHSRFRDIWELQTNSWISPRLKKIYIFYLFKSYWLWDMMSAWKPPITPQHPRTKTRKNLAQVRKVEGPFVINSYLWIFPRVLPATALNLSGRISILAALTRPVCWCPARAPFVPERAPFLSGSLSHPSLHGPAHSPQLGRRQVYKPPTSSLSSGRLW